MKLCGVKLILACTFVFFLVHDFIPHLHLTDHTHICLTEAKETKEEHHEDTSPLSHHIHDAFVSKKPLNSSFKYKMVSFIHTVLQYDLQAGEYSLNILINKQELLPALPVVNSFSLRAPPVI